MLADPEFELLLFPEPEPACVVEEGDGEVDGVGAGVGLTTTFTPFDQTFLLPLLMQVKTCPPEVIFWFKVLQVVPGFGAAARAGASVEAVKIKTIIAESFLMDIDFKLSLLKKP
jgi:hypothetical protein